MRDAAAIRVHFHGRIGAFTLEAEFAAPAVGVSALFGPSGCGKTTVLRCIAGLHRMAHGFCAVGDEVWQEGKCFRPAYRRAVGYVFQEASLFPHLSVCGNLLYGAGRSRGRSARMEVGFDEVADLLGLVPLLDRRPQHLSGGERQRVAVGRALLSQPKLLLMDEPLSALDRATRDEILPFLERLHDRLSLPVIYVSHDMAEVERLADHLILMENGRVIASGPLSSLQSDPALPLLRAREAAVSLEAKVEAYDPVYGMASLAVDGAALLVPVAAAIPGERKRLRVGASDVSLARERPGRTTIINVLPARIVSATASGEHEITAVLGLGPQGTGARLLARITRRSWDLLELSPGLDVYAQVKGVALVPRQSSPAT